MDLPLLSRAPTSPRRRTAGREPGRRTEGAPVYKQPSSGNRLLKGKRTGQPLGPEHAGPLVEWQIAGDDGGAALIALAEDLEQELGAGRRKGYIAEFIDDQQLVTGQLALQAEQSLLVPGLDQPVDHGGRGGEAD